MYTIKSTAGGMLLNHYGKFGTFDDASRVAVRVRGAMRLAGFLNTYTVVPVPADVTPMPIHPKYLD